VRRRHLVLAAAVVASFANPGRAEVDGVALSPTVAQALYDRLAPLRESDGCRLARFDTSRSRVTVGLRSGAGAERAFVLATAPEEGAPGHRVGGWTLAVPPELERDCAATLGVVERVLLETPAPRGERLDAGGSALATSGAALGRINRVLLAGSFVLLVLGVLHVLAREAKARRPPPSAVLALALVWLAALALRLLLSPRTFLHEYYHVAETLLAYLAGEGRPLYGDAGPALFQLAGGALGRPDDAQVIFVTNAILASLAVPAVALLDLALVGSWPRALCAAVFLGVLPQHLRFSASEVLFVPAVTLGMAALGLFALYVRTHRLEDALCAALALSLAVQTRPEMLFFPALLVALVLLAEPRSWRVLVERRTLLALSVAGVLLVPRLLEVLPLLGGDSPAAALPDVHRYWNSLVLLRGDVTPPLYWLVLLVGLPFGLRDRPGLVVWSILACAGYSVFSLSLYDNGPYNVRSQLLAMSFTVFIAAGAGPAWMALWGRRRRLAVATGACALAGLGTVVTVRSYGFVTELRDQQLEWAFLQRTVPRLPERATLLTAVEIGGRNLDAFPQFLLRSEKKDYRMIDLRRATAGEEPWPAPGDDLLFYQGMFCYFAFPDEPSPDPMTAACRMVHERYVAEPLFVEDLDTQGFSWLRYARGPFRIGFFRLRALR
jgi:hypothetical protein